MSATLPERRAMRNERRTGTPAGATKTPEQQPRSGPTTRSTAIPGGVFPQNPQSNQHPHSNSQLQRPTPNSGPNQSHRHHHRITPPILQVPHPLVTTVLHAPRSALNQLQRVHKPTLLRKKNNLPPASSGHLFSSNQRTSSSARAAPALHRGAMAVHSLASPRQRQRHPSSPFTSRPHRAALKVNRMTVASSVPQTINLHRSAVVKPPPKQIRGRHRRHRRGCPRL